MIQESTQGGARRTASKSARVVTEARKLRQRSERETKRLFLADGPQSVEYGLRAQLVKRVFVTERGAQRFAADVARALDDGIEVIEIEDAVMASISDTKTPQGILGIASMPQVEADPWAQSPRHVVALEQAQDPGNVGVVIRTADAVGVDFVVLGPGSADPFGPKSVRASAGSVFAVPVLCVDSISEPVERARGLGMCVRGTTGAAVAELFSDSGPDLLKATMWVFGNEANGLSDEVSSRCDELVRIPMYGTSESLNVGASAAICMYATAIAQRNAAVDET